MFLRTYKIVITFFLRCIMITVSNGEQISISKNNYSWGFKQNFCIEYPWYPKAE